MSLAIYFSCLVSFSFLPIVDEGQKEDIKQQIEEALNELGIHAKTEGLSIIKYLFVSYTATGGLISWAVFTKLKFSEIESFFTVLNDLDRLILYLALILFSHFGFQFPLTTHHRKISRVNDMNIPL